MATFESLKALRCWKPFSWKAACCGRLPLWL